MTISTLEAAIARMEEHKAGCEPELPLRSGFYGSGDAWPEGTELESADGYHLMRAEGHDAHLFHLLAALSRAVDPILSVLRGEVQHVADTGERFDSNIVELAVAVLGEVEHD